jgi:hypothetical protein
MNLKTATQRNNRKKNPLLPNQAFRQLGGCRHFAGLSPRRSENQNSINQNSGRLGPVFKQIAITASPVMRDKMN